MTAYEEIRQLAARYAHALDARELDTLVNLFVDDVQVGPDGRGRDALRVFFEAELRDLTATFLLVGSHVIDLVDDNHASGQVYCHGQIQRQGTWVDQAICYTDSYERRDGHWLFVRRRHDVRHER